MSKTNTVKTKNGMVTDMSLLTSTTINSQNLHVLQLKMWEKWKKTPTSAQIVWLYWIRKESARLVVHTLKCDTTTSMCGTHAMGYDMMEVRTTIKSRRLLALRQNAPLCNANP